MLFSILLFILILFLTANRSFYRRISLSLFCAVSHLSFTAFIARSLGLTELRKNLLSFSFLSTKSAVTGVSILVFLFLLSTVLIIKKTGLIDRIFQSLNWRLQLSFFIFSLLVFIGALAGNSAVWTKNFFGNVGISEILYTLSQPLTGTDAGQIYTFILGPLLNSVILTLSFLVILYLLLYALSYKKFQQIKLTKKTSFFFAFISVSLTIYGFFFGIQTLGYAELKAYFFEKSTIYEDFYVDPNDVALTFPEQKRNLIYIYVESLESTYLSIDLGGMQEVNLLPNLTESAYADGLNFSHQSTFGGARQVPGVGFTVGGMVAQSSGVPLRVSGGYNENEYGNTSSFMPGVTTIGTILDQEGYNQTLLIGSDASFGGRDKFYSQHGNYQIKDYQYAIDNQWIPSDYKVWWGYEDEKLFEFAKNILIEDSQSEEPFNLTLLTADMHFPDGLMTENTPKLFEQQYSNVIHYSDYMLGNFIRWVQQQSFYDNTTIVIAGDHLSMDPSFFNGIPEDYERTVFNLFINSPVTTLNNTNRSFSTLDLFPTTLSALGVSIEGNRLGLGTNLFSEEMTLMEKLGFDEFSNELSKTSSFYNQQIMQGSDLEVK